MKKFTLIELLVVISIIGILTSMLLPSLKRARSLAKQSVCASNLKQQGVAVSLYALSNKGMLPPHLTSPPPPFTPPYGPDRLAIYLNGTLADSLEIFQCPSVQSHHPLGDYADNSHIYPNIMQGSPGRFISSYSRPAELMSHTDSGFRDNLSKGSWWMPCSVSSPINNIQAVGRHNNKAVVLFLDFHVEATKITNVYNNANDLWGHLSR